MTIDESGVAHKKEVVDKKNVVDKNASMPFEFTSADEPTTEQRPNPHAKESTNVQATVDALKARFGDAIVDVTLYANEHTVRIQKSVIAEVCRHLRDELGFTFLVDLGGADRFTEDERYEVFYNIVNVKAGKRIRLKVRVDEDELTVPTVMYIYPGANWNEREVFDMLGIRFDGHEDMRRVYLPEDFEYYPLRKEFPQLGIPGSLPLPPRSPEAGLTWDPFAAAHQGPTIKSYQEPKSADEDQE
ncbi:MAG: NADH-quinone oxidoreductase subunit C [Bacteroidetes bacterium]|nr:NADH-quinone oxidoreductase subunit C [Bacteroidota bacterium]